MDPHRRARLLGVLEAEGLDALVATTPENLYYVTGFRSVSHAIFRGAELYGVFTRGGTGLVVPLIDPAGVAADRIACDRVACYGKFFFEYADPAGEAGEKVRRWTRAPAASAPHALAGGCPPPGSSPPTSSSAAHGWSRAPPRSRGSSAPRGSPRPASPRFSRCWRRA